MSFVSRVYENRRSMASVSVVTLFAAGLLGAALLYDGEATADIELNDSGVWVTQTASGKLGRFNYEAKALDGTLLANSSSFDVEQDAQRVLLDSVGNSSASPVDPAQLVLRGTMMFPAGAQVSAGGATAAVYDAETGRMWALPFDGATVFDEEELKPTLKAGKGGELTVSNDGVVFLAVPADGKLYTIPTSTRGVAEVIEETTLPVANNAEVQVSAVGDQPIVLNQSTGTLVLPDGDTVEVEDGAQGVLQQPSDDSDNVVLATSKGLVSQPLSGGDATIRTASGASSGIPSAPAQVGECSYGAWSGSGQVIRDCPGPDHDVDMVLEGVDKEARLVYRVNRDIIVLNDVANGSLWMAADQFEKVDDWDLKMPEDAEGKKAESEDTTPEQVDQFVASRDEKNRPPQPKDDSIGVRPGRTTVLNVLGNDVDPDGDVMTASVKGTPKGDITVNQVLNGAALQADVPVDATGTTTFDYQVDDGREGGTATASVKVRVVPFKENNPPVQTGEPVLRVGQDGSASIQVLPYFKDPDGDDLILTHASTADNLDEVRFRPDGTIDFRDGGATTGRKVVEITVADSLGMPTEGKLLVDVVASNVPPVAVQDHVTVLAGKPVTVYPLRNDHDPNGDTLRLTKVAESKKGAITRNLTAGTFKFQYDKPGSYDVTYQITDGPNPMMGLVRVDVITPPDEPGPPVAVSDQVLLPTGGTALVDVLANDTDPAGGVLVVQGIDVPADSPVSVSVLNHQILKVSEIKRLDTPVTVTYTVANGSGTTSGQVSVVPIAAPAQLRPPEAGPDEVIVHAGDVVTIPVLKNDTHPDGLKLSLNDELQEVPAESAGEAFVSEDTVRFRAGQKAGSYHAVYEVVDSHGQKDSAQVTITVVDDPRNAAPQLPDIEARVLSGGIVRIPMPLDGTDPDGDYVTLNSISSAPSQGTATIVDGFVDYQAAENATGLDSFTYQVMDTRGAVGEGMVRIGVATPPASNQKPQAIDDETTVRPGRTVAVAALANDSDPDGDQIGLVAEGFGGTQGLDPQAVDDTVVVSAPKKNGASSFYYGIQDTYKAQASGAITVNVDENAPLLRPIAHDDVVTVDDVEGSSSVTVGVLENDADPDGVGSDLQVSVDSALDGVTITDAKKIKVQLSDRAQVITYTVTDMDGLEAQAFVRVPGNQTRPYIKPGLKPLQATSGEPLTLDIADVVMVRDARMPRITEEKSVKATDGRVTVQDHDTVNYTSAEDYAGAASVSFEVTDGDGPDDSEGLVSVLTVPIDVAPAKNLPPRVSGTPVLEVAAGEEAAVDLSRYVTDPDKDPLTYDVSGGDGMSIRITGSTVSAQVEPSIPKGTVRPIKFTVTDGVNSAVGAQLSIKVVASTRPLVQTSPDQVLDAYQGEPTSIPVLLNDTNPFPETPLTLTGEPSIDTGVGEPEYRGDELVVTPAKDFTGAMIVRYRVQDATKDPDREVDGFAKLTVLGRPEAPRAPRIEEVRSETVVLSWDQPNNNGSEITGYTLTASNGQEHECLTTTCTFDGLKNNVKYTFTVTATNDVGESDPSPASREARPDAKPDKPEPPSLVFGDQSLTVTWKNKSYTDRSQIECVNLEISPAPPNGVTQKPCLTGGKTTWTGLENGTAYTVRVQAKNAAPDPSDWSDPSAAEIPAAPPAQPAAPKASRVNTAVGGQITVNWTAPANNGDAVEEYYLTIFQDGSRGRTITTTSTSQTIQDLSTHSSYRFTVMAKNKAGKSPDSAKSNEVVPFGTPNKPAKPAASLGSKTSGQANVRWTAISNFRGTGPRYEVRANQTGRKNAGNVTSYTYQGLKNGTAYSFDVRACNQYTCSAWSVASNQVTPYGPVPKPTIRATGGDRKVTFTWDARATNGRPTTVKVSGAISSTAKSGTKSVSAGYSTTKKACVTVTDTAGQTAQACDSAKTNARPEPTARVSRGDRVNNSQCSTSACAYFRVTFTDFPSGGHRVECWSGTNGATSGWHNILEPNRSTPGGQTEGGTRRFSGDGSVQLNCFYGYAGTQVRVYIDGEPYAISTW